MPLPVKSLDFSPNQEFLATAHFETLGVYLWCNKTLFKTVSLNPLESSCTPKRLTFPRVVADVKEFDENEEEEEPEDDDVRGENKGSKDTQMDIEYSSPEQISERLITLSLQPSSRWKNLYNIDLIKVIFLILTFE
jgi:U3 small nucleolar RNA-associated protein 21